MIAVTALRKIHHSEGVLALRALSCFRSGGKHAASSSSSIAPVAPLDSRLFFTFGSPDIHHVGGSTCAKGSDAILTMR